MRGNAEALNPIARHVRERGWVWGSWVCPVVSLGFPFQIVRDVQAATNPHGRRTALIGWWWAEFLVLNLTLNAYSFRDGEGLDFAEVKAFNAIAGIGEVIGLLVSLAAGTLWAASSSGSNATRRPCWLAVKRPARPDRHQLGGGLGELRLEAGVCDDPGAGKQADPVAVESGRAQSDAELAVSARVDPSDRPRVMTALHALELADELEGLESRCAADSSRRVQRVGELEC